MTHVSIVRYCALFIDNNNTKSEPIFIIVCEEANETKIVDDLVVYLTDKKPKLFKLCFRGKDILKFHEGLKSSLEYLIAEWPSITKHKAKYKDKDLKVKKGVNVLNVSKAKFFEYDSWDLKNVKDFDDSVKLDERIVVNKNKKLITYKFNKKDDKEVFEVAWTTHKLPTLYYNMSEIISKFSD